MPDCTRFIILANVRTGSTMLASYLNSHPYVVCFREVFSFTLPSINYGVDGYEGWDEDDLAFRKRDPIRFLHDRIYGGHGDQVEAAGFKFLYSHIYGFKDIAQHLVDDAEIRVVHLVRKNVIRASVSMKVAEATGLWVEEPRSWRRFTARLPRRLVRAARHPARTWQRRQERAKNENLRSGTPAALNSNRDLPATTITLTEKQCRDELWMQAIAVESQERRYSAHPTITVSYEELVESPEETLARIQEFLGVEPRPLAPTTRQQNPQPLSKLIENYDEIREAFRDTEYAWMFEEE